MSRTEKLYVLYGSQMGNSEGAAREFCNLIKSTYNDDFFAKHKLPSLEVETTCIQLDDFLEVKHADYTKCLVIFVSSYGVGQAPLGSYRFRDLCDEFLTNDGSNTNILTGLKYAICGLGDSNYTTFLKNPTTIDQGLQKAGAKRLGELAKCDASAMGEQAQDKVIQKWSKDMLLPLAKALAATEEVDTAKMQAETIPLMVKLDPDYTPPNAASKGGSDMCTYIGIGAVVVGGLAIVASQYM
ncbi:unnamed protein product [Cylindrotheca closterium]|uniref:Flavodoxin-like domain-containing protein n=1 Tax=Cylindrotheca closterium TaxID=2856 RepID=A0AAD2FT18_9STRA|nr:unnamed protein product [Cylindrotheca closterium]